MGPRTTERVILDEIHYAQGRIRPLWKIILSPRIPRGYTLRMPDDSNLYMNGEDFDGLISYEWGDDMVGEVRAIHGLTVEDRRGR